MGFQGQLRTFKTMNAKSMSQGLIVLSASAWYSIIIFSDNQNSIHLNEPLQAFVGFQISDFSVLAFEFYFLNANIKSRCPDGSLEKLQKNH